MEKLSEITRRIFEILKNSELENEGTHAQNVLKWVFKLATNPSEALQIAAVAHDIERGVPPRVQSSQYPDNTEFRIVHSARSAKIITELMEEFQYDQDVIANVVDLVNKHEIGGSVDADILLDADSISFFDNNLPYYVGRKGLAGSVFQVEYKFSRCTDRAKQFIRQLPEYIDFLEKTKAENLIS